MIKFPQKPTLQKEGEGIKKDYILVAQDTIHAGAFHGLISKKEYYFVKNDEDIFKTDCRWEYYWQVVRVEE
jgi:hypothetical protein